MSLVNSKTFSNKNILVVDKLQSGLKITSSDHYGEILSVISQEPETIYRITTSMGFFDCCGSQKVMTGTSVENMIKIQAKHLKYTNNVFFSLCPLDGSVGTSIPDFLTQDKEKGYKLRLSSKIDTETAWFIGMIQSCFFYGTDSIIVEIQFGEEENMFQYDTKNRDVAERIKRNLLNLCSKLDVNIDTYEKSGKYSVSCTNEKMFKFLQRIQNRISFNEIRVHEFLFSSTVEIREAYIAGVIDGSSVLKRDNFNITTITYSEFTKDLQILLSGLGHQSRDCFVTERIPSFSNTYSVNYSLDLVFNNKSRDFGEVIKMVTRQEVKKHYMKLAPKRTDTIKPLKFVFESVYVDKVEAHKGLHKNYKITTDKDCPYICDGYLFA